MPASVDGVWILGIGVRNHSPRPHRVGLCVLVRDVSQRSTRLGVFIREGIPGFWVIFSEPPRPPTAVGLVFVVLGADGRIRRDYVFTEGQV